MKEILVASDGSEAADAALAVGLDLAVEQGADLVIAHVVSVLDFAVHADGKAPRSATRAPRAEDDVVLCAALELAEARGVKTRSELLVGNASEQIIRLAHEIDAQLIVVGSRGLGRVKSAVLGSTSREVVAHADRPVLVVRETPAAEPVPA
jgi:nucleotide-binding universal stress UspA family protein